MRRDFGDSDFFVADSSWKTQASSAVRQKGDAFESLRSLWDGVITMRVKGVFCFFSIKRSNALKPFFQDFQVQKATNQHRIAGSSPFVPVSLAGPQHPVGHNSIPAGGTWKT